MKKIIISVLFLVLLLSSAGCSSDKVTDLEEQVKDLQEKLEKLEEEKTNLENSINNLDNELEESKDKVLMYESGLYKIKVIDIDDEVLADKEIYVKKYDSFFSALTSEFEVSYTETEYGPYISSINNSIIDNNYYMAIYKNSTLSSVGVNEITYQAGDVFEFKVECFNTIESGFGTFDSTDILVDKAIYHYAKKYMKEYLMTQKTFEGSNYWTFMSIYMMSSLGYDESVFNTLSVTEDLKNSIINKDISTLKNANIGKYYYVKRALKQDLTTFDEFYGNYVNEISTTYSEYTTPFTMSMAYSLNKTSDRLTELINTTYLASTNYGIDGLSWQVTSLQLFNKYDKSILSNFPTKNYGSGTSTALALLPYASLNINPRSLEYQDVEGNDLIEVLFDNYYDENLQLLKVKTTDTTTNMSTNQIYASLMAYKAQRDLNKAVNIFA